MESGSPSPARLPVPCPLEKLCHIVKLLDGGDYDEEMLIDMAAEGEDLPRLKPKKAPVRATASGLLPEEAIGPPSPR